MVNQIRNAHKLLEEFSQLLRKQIVVVVADAGYGAQLAAQLTMANNERAAGILLYGRELQAGLNLNEFAQKNVINGDKVPTFEALIAAVDAAGQRCHQRATDCHRRTK